MTDESDLADNRLAEDAAGDVAAVVQATRAAQTAWAAVPLPRRLQVLRRLRHRLGEQPEAFTAAVTLPQRQGEAETLAAEVLPLADALKWLEQEASRVLAAQRLSNRRRPLWLAGVQVAQQRDPLGVVLILGTWNYPLFLVGVQAAQALAAGNAVLIKPGRDSTTAAVALRDALVEAGLDPDLCAVLPETTAAAQAAMRAGVDHVVLTGSAATGRAVLGDLAASLTPAAMELSGCDAVFVRGDADLDLVVQALTLGMRFNSSATCIAPRRVFVHQAVSAELQTRLAAAFDMLPAVPVDARTAQHLEALVEDAIAAGASRQCGEIAAGEGDAGTRAALRMVRPFLLIDASADAELLKSDVFAPVLSVIAVQDDAEALRLDACCPYALGATVFGRGDGAERLAQQIDAGCVVVNDFLIPTADPRVSFGGRRGSGFGTTRGAAGLLAMTQPKTIIQQHGDWRPHLEPTSDADVQFFTQYLAAAHGSGWRVRVAAGWRFLRECLKRQRSRGV